MRPTEDLIVAAVLPRARLAGSGVYSELDYVLKQNVDVTYFTGPHQHLFRCSIGANLAGTPLDEEVLNSLLQQHQVPQTEWLTCQIMFRDLVTIDVPREKLKVLVPPFRDGVHAQRMAVALTEAAEVLTNGLKVDGEVRQGYRDAKHHVMHRLSELDQREKGTLPVKEARETATEMLEEYEQTKKGREPGILTGFREIDGLTNGLQKGELGIFCGYPGDGKTQFLLNVAWHAVARQKKNVVFVSLEMPVDQVRRRIISRHTNHLKFGLPGGLEYTKIKQGKLDKYEEKMFVEVINDWKTCEDYGSLTIMQISKYDTVPVLFEKLMYYRSQRPLDALVLDYASLMSGTRRRSDRREEIVEVVEYLKEGCLTFNEGEGLATYTANQTSRKAREEAEQLKRYGINFASETSAIEKNADLLGWILRLDEFKANREVLMGLAKYRDGDIGRDFRLMEHYESSLLADLAGGTTSWA